MSDAGTVDMGEQVFIGSSLYAATERDEATVTFAHECPDGTIRLATLGIYEDVVTIPEHLMDLRGLLEHATRLASREFGNPLRKQIARTQRDRIQAEIDALEDAGHRAGMTLGAET
jgi:hypothetical protein